MIFETDDPVAVASVLILMAWSLSKKDEINSTEEHESGEKNGLIHNIVVRNDDARDGLVARNRSLGSNKDDLIWYG